MNPVVFGDGYLGTEIAYYLQCPTTKDIEDIDFYDTVINAAGRTGRPNVDWCEDHQQETIDSNIILPMKLAEKCLEQGKYFVHIGSGCIYHDLTGTPIPETQLGNFEGCSFYSKTKMISELALDLYPNVLQLRIRMPIDSTANSRNLLNKILGYEKVLDVKNSMTVIPDLLFAMERLMEKKKTGIYNVVNPGAISPYEVVELYKKMVNPEHKVIKIGLEELDTMTKAKRSNCVLDTSKLQAEGIILEPIGKRVRELLVDFPQ